VAALGPVMLQIAGEHADGTSLWMADEKAIGEHIAPKITRPPRRRVNPTPDRGRHPRHAGAPTPRSTRPRSGPTILPRPRRRRTISVSSIAAMPAPSVISVRPVTKESILKRFKQFADAGVTDLSVRLLPIGDTRDELIASKYRTREVIAELAKQVG
jgi:hypothetical protein